MHGNPWTIDLVVVVTGALHGNRPGRADLVVVVTDAKHKPCQPLGTEGGGMDTCSRVDVVNNARLAKPTHVGSWEASKQAKASRKV